MMFGRQICFILATGCLIINCVNGGFMDSLTNYGCSWFSCCIRQWEISDFSDLTSALKKNVYGQHIAISIVVPALIAHLRNPYHKSKALALSFHGRPGIGKNYVTKYIQNILYDKNYPSGNTHFFSGRLNFPLEREVDIYKLNLIKWIQGNVSRCEYSTFIFDEVDKMPPKVLDAVKPFIDYHESIGDVDFRKAVFIFLSNTGGDAIAEKFLEYWKSGRKREELILRDFEDIIRIGAFNEKGGFYKSETIESSLIDHYIPFLPLEQEHVIRCIQDEFTKRKYYPKQEDLKEILDDIVFGPPDQPVFSNSGCKRISQKVAALVEKKKGHWEL